MKQIEINPSNKPYYSEDFIKGFECGTKTQFDADRTDREYAVHELVQVRDKMSEILDDLPDNSDAHSIVFECVQDIHELIAVVLS